MSKKNIKKKNRNTSLSLRIRYIVSEHVSVNATENENFLHVIKNGAKKLKSFGVISTNRNFEESGIESMENKFFIQSIFLKPSFSELSEKEIDEVIMKDNVKSSITKFIEDSDADISINLKSQYKSNVNEELLKINDRKERENEKLRKDEFNFKQIITMLDMKIKNLEKEMEDERKLNGKKIKELEKNAENERKVLKNERDIVDGLIDKIKELEKIVESKRKLNMELEKNAESDRKLNMKKIKELEKIVESERKLNMKRIKELRKVLKNERGIVDGFIDKMKVKNNEIDVLRRKIKRGENERESLIMEFVREREMLKQEIGKGKQEREMLKQEFEKVLKNQAALVYDIIEKQFDRFKDPNNIDLDIDPENTKK